MLPKFRDFIKSTPEEAAAKEADLVACLKGLNDYLAEQGPYIGGEAPCATDCAVMPRLYHMQVGCMGVCGFNEWPSWVERGNPAWEWKERCAGRHVQPVRDLRIDVGEGGRPPLPPRGNSSPSILLLSLPTLPPGCPPSFTPTHLHVPLLVTTKHF